MNRLARLLALLSVAAASAQQNDSFDPATVLAEQLPPQASYTVRRSYLGVVRPRREASIGFEVGGLLQSVLVREGDTFTAGDELASLHSSMERAAFELAQAQLRMSEEDQQLAEDMYRRQSQLDEAGHSSDQSMDERRHDLAVRQAQLEVARRRLQQADVSMQQHSLLAPWDGAVQRRFLDEGSVVSPGQPVLHLVETGALEAEINVAERIGRHLRIGQLYDLEVNNQLLRAPLLRLSPALDGGSRTQQAFFALPEDAAISGSGARLLFATAIEQPGYWVPLHALTQLRQGLWGVLVAVPAAEQRFVELGERIVEVIHIDSDFAYVNGTLRPGELVVTSSASDLVAGQQVRLRRPH